MSHTFEPKLIKGKFLRRYKRFFLDAESESGETLVAHCANTGSMKGLLEEGYYAWLKYHSDPKRKLRYSVEMMETPTSLVGVNTSLPNALVAEAIANDEIESLTGYANLKREVKYGVDGKSRIDVHLSEEGKPDVYVEVKNTTMRTGDAALFPDAVTTRGTKHLNELIEVAKQGKRAVMFYLVQRMDCEYFSVAEEIDSVYAETLRKAMNNGVEVLAYKCHLSPEEIRIDEQMEVRI